MSKYALLVVDMINEFVTGNLGCERGLAVVPKCVELLEGARAKGLPVIYCCDAHVEGDGELKLWGTHALANTDESAIIPELAPLPGEHIVHKRRYSGFWGTDLDMRLRELGVDGVIICGLLVNLCIQHTACDAYLNGYEVIVPSDTTDAITKEVYDYCMDYLPMAYGAKTTPVTELLESL